MRDIKQYQDNYGLAPFEAYQVKFRKKKILEALSKHNHNSILEVGCGLSSIMNDVSDFTLLDIVEPGDKFCNKAREDSMLVDSTKNVSIHNEYYELWEPGPMYNSPEFIIISSLLHEVENPLELLKKNRIISGPETVTHINVPNARSFHRLMAVEMKLIGNVFEKSATQQKFQQYRIFDLESLADMAEKSGFKVMESGSYFVKPFTHGQMDEMTRAGLITTEMLEGLYEMEKYMPGLGSEIYINIKKV
jgi:hypothetical protein